MATQRHRVQERIEARGEPRPLVDRRKIAVLNFSGNVGKSTLATQLLAPRMGGDAAGDSTPVYSVESLNVDGAADGVNVLRRRGKDYGEIIEDINLLETGAIVDVGSSNVAEFMQHMTTLKTAHDVFDLFLIPVIPDRKAQTDTINTIAALAKLGVPAAKIVVVFNKVPLDDNAEDVFAPLYGACEVHKNFTIRPGAVIYHSEAFDKVKAHKCSLTALCADPADYRVQARAERDPEERKRLIRRYTLKLLASSAVDNLNAVYGAIAS